MNMQELLKKLDENASTGFDLSPGDPVCKEAATAIRKLQSEVEFLSGVMQGEPALKLFKYTQEDGFEGQIEHWAVKLIAASLADSLLDGRNPEDSNFVTMDLVSDIGPLVMTIQKKCSKKTPSTIIAELTARVAELEKENAV